MINVFMCFSTYGNQFYVFQRFKILVIPIMRSGSYTGVLSHTPLLYQPAHVGVDIRHKLCIAECILWVIN